ncbi:hypothetical protein [Prescottella agglutinans]|uniref:Uncharacterized protein n=1 Tax=Prescottella agglutinans TaxID=1644129 RepID=A0ABT6MFZ4_9NOCA|nr:hypothetical protein [Prescottella agglutinans]MDH6283246.1 hypothetical protein [Prescottella agglutinans]
MEPIFLPELPGHTITISLIGSWLSVEIRDTSDEIRYAAGWDIEPAA